MMKRSGQGKSREIDVERFAYDRASAVGTDQEPTAMGFLEPSGA